MSKFVTISQKVIASKRMTPRIEQELSQLLWSKEFSPAEMACLQQLDFLLERGLIKVEETTSV